jgi:hypothetical protein
MVADDDGTDFTFAADKQTDLPVDFTGDER